MTRDDRGGMPGGEAPSITHVPPVHLPWEALAWAPVAAFALATAVLVGASVESAWDSPPLLLMLNTLFLAVVSMLVTVLAGQSYLAGQGGSVLLLGCGALALGFGAVLAGLPPGRSDPNYTATVYNLSALLASICHLASAAWVHRQGHRPRRPTGRVMAVLYPSVIVLIILVAAAARAELLPPFFLDGTGTTGLNRAVLWTAAVLFALSGAGLWGRHRRARSTFLRWYALGLVLLAVGLAAVSFQKRFGTPLNWTGRSAQYLGGLYMLIAALSAARRGQVWTLSLETQLTEARQQYRTLVDLCPEAILVHMDGRYVFANAAALQLFGAQRADEFIGRDTLSLVHPDDREAVAARMRLTGRDRQTVPAREFTILRLDGTPVSVEASAAPIPFQGRLAVQVVLRDVSARKRAQEALRQSEERFRLALKNAPVSVAVQDLDLRFVWAYNQRTARPEEILGKTDAEIFTPEEARRLVAIKRRVIAENVEHREPMWLDRPGGRMFLDVYFEPVRDEAGRVVGVGSATVDLTPAKLAQEALRQAVEDLEQSNEDLQQFAYVASHDLQEPLRMVSGFLTLLKDRYAGVLDEKAREYIDYSVDGAARMRQLITDLLTYSRVTSKGLSPQLVEAEGALASALANLAARVGEAGAAVTHDPLPAVVGDPTQLTQLFQNLIANAVKFRSPEVPCRIHVGAAQRDGQWVFSVRDNGIGVPADSLERIFKIFERLHTRDKYPGTGIGLAICKKIVERHGGRIWVESTPGQGATFLFTLPRN